MPRKEKKYHIMYRTTNIVNGKFYVGVHSTDNLDDGYLGSGQHLRRSVKKYGSDKFFRQILEFFDSRQDSLNRERDFVNAEFLKNPLCMNLRPGGTAAPESNFGSKRTEETRKKMSAWERTPEMRAKMSAWQKGKSYEEKLGDVKATSQKVKLSRWQKGKSFEDKVGAERAKEWREKTGQSQKGKIKHSEESKSVISKKNKGRKRPDNVRRNKAVVQMDLVGNIISTFPSVTIASQNTGCHKSKIVLVCQGKRKQSNGFKWKYQDK